MLTRLKSHQGHCLVFPKWSRFTSNLWNCGWFTMHDCHLVAAYGIPINSSKYVGVDSPNMALWWTSASLLMSLYIILFPILLFVLINFLFIVLLLSQSVLTVLHFFKKHFRKPAVLFTAYCYIFCIWIKMTFIFFFCVLPFIPFPFRQSSTSHNALRSLVGSWTKAVSKLLARAAVTKVCFLSLF